MEYGIPTVKKIRGDGGYRLAVAERRHSLAQHVRAGKALLGDRLPLQRTAPFREYPRT